ncbi:histone-lysine N-methyltransferase 2B-like protein [Labeo rohita]|uniref:Histone-lysine N-methyltransferase 2B-like protein n=1 Tax=Labeo rohita TaxID=84645 RepID=A0A498LUG1_LABRO|nr:histone-lysine N-methyltransferase 2B-like protein [Labeo rohita]
MVIKMAAKKVTKKGVEQAQRPSVDKDGQLKQGSSNKRNGRVLKNQREGTRVSSKTENDENVDGAFEEEEVTERSKKHGTGAVDRQKRQGKLVWTLTLVKGKEQARRVRDTQNQKASTEYAKTHRNKKIAGGDQASGVSLKPVAKRGRGRRTEVKEEPLESLGGDAGVSFSDTLSSSQKKPFVRRRKKLLQQEVCHKVPDSQGQASSMPRKRKRLSLESDSTHLLQPVEGQEQMLGEVERPKSGGRAAQPKHSIRPVISARSSRVIKVPKRFMDDERMSALPERGSPKKPALTEISMDVGKPNVEFQTLDSESKLKTAQEPLILNDEKGVSEKVQSQGVKPVLSSSRPSGGSRGRGRRPGQTADHYKIYWKLKKLTACLTKRRMERLASAGSKLTEVGAEEETYDVEESKSDLKLEDLYSPGVVPKVAIHVGDESDQTQLASLAEGPAKENVETTNLESTEMTAQNTQMMVEQSGNTQRMSISGANKRMFHLLKRARVQLIKIDQQKQLKSAQLLSGSVRIRDGTATVRQRGRKRGKRVVPANPEGAPQSSGEHTPSSVLTPLVNGCTQRGKLSQGTMNKIRVDFKEDCHIQNVWLMGGLSILTSVPIMPQFVCLLCASKGQHDMIYCQMCCEPFHQFCLPPDDRPKEENKENWCCRRCKFCHVCGRKSKQAKPVLQCKRCMYCYHPSCLGPTYPKPVKMNTSWICMLCIRCKSCGVTPGKSSDTSWNHELDLCPDCTKLHSKGNFCTVCLKCYEEHEFDSSMMQCARCAHWVHPKCEGLTDDLYEILCRLRGKSLVFSCAPCSKRFRSGWQDVVQEVLRNGLEKIMNGLKNSPNICHLLMCAQCEVCPDFEVVKEQSGCCLHPVEQKLESGLYTSLKAFHEDVVAVMVERLRKEKYLLEEQKPTGHAKLYYIKLVEQVFSWFNSQDPKTWNSHIQEFPSGMLPEAVIPPGDEHSYAQWLKENPQSKSQDEDGTDSESFSPGLPPSTPSKTKQDSGAGGKTPGYPHSRRPAGGMSRPLPSPGNAVSTSHHILTISDLDETRRATRRRSRNASPPPVVHSGPMALRSGGSIHPRSLSFSPPVSPLGATENLMSSTPPRRRGRPSSSSPSSVTSGPSPPQAALRSPSSTLPSSVRHSPRQQQPFRTTQHKTDEVVQELFALSEPEEAASHGIPTASDRSNQELLSAHFDPDTDVAVASVLNAKLEFDEALLNENVALDCDPQGGEEEGACRFITGRKDLSSPVASEMQMETVEDVADHYLNFSRTVVVCEPAKDSAQAGLSVLPNSGSISQLDGADNDSESDTGEANADDDTQEVESSFCSQDTEPLKHTGPNKGRTLDDRQLVCPGAPDSVDQNFQPETQTVDQVCEEQGIQEITLQDGGNMIVDSDSNVQKASFPEELKASTPVLYKSSDLVTTQEEVLLESESTESLQEVFLDDTSGNFISAVDGRVLDLTENNAGHEAATGFSPINQDEHVLTRGLSPVEKPAASVPASNTRTIHVVAPSMPAKRRFVTIRPGSQPRTLQMPMTVASSLPLSVPVSVVSSSPTFSVASQGTPLAPTSVLINGFGALPKEATKGRTIAIRIATPKQVTEQPLPHCLPGAPPTPQVLLVNRAGQILVKNPQTNTYQLPSSNSPSYTQISQIAKIIHSSNVLQRPLPKVTVIPVQQVQASLGKTTPARIISYSSNNGAAPPTQVLIRRIPQSYPGSQLQSTSPSIEKAGSVSESGQKEVAQAIIDKAMASHREITSPTGISPAQLHVEKRLSPESKESFPGFRLRTQPNILSHSRPQVKIKRVSSVTDRIGVKKCRTDFLDQLDPCSQDDHSRSNRVRIKAPSVKDVLDFDDPDVGSLDQPKNEEFKVAEKERITPTVEPTAAQGNDKQDRAKSPCSSKHGDSSDWAPYAGWSSDEDSPSPGKQDKCASQYLPHLRFQITSEDGFSVEADSMDVAWKAVMDGVQEARVGCRLEQFPFNRVSGARVLGVLHDAVLFLLEQLQGASLCQKHCFRFHQHEVPEEELPINPSGCARAEVYVRKSTFDMFNFLASQHRQLPESRPCDDEEDDVMLKSSRRATSTELPMAMRFRHLEKTSKEAVGVYRSAIHGRGLFCKRNIEAGEMVIEYAGNVIRAVLTDKREKYYDSKGIGCYMFRIDDFDVVDATMHGNAARFINHSCDPNCYSRVINVEGQKHIVIFALRKIYRGEELTYDYKFPIEDANNKLHCNCGARRCRRFLN